MCRQNKKSTTQQERQFNLFMDSLVQELGTLLGQSTRIFPLPQLPQAKKVFREVEQFLVDCKMQELDNKHRKVLYNIIASVLVKYAHDVSLKAKIPVNMKLVLQTTTPIGALVDNFYPGYVKAGVMLILLKQAMQGYQLEADDE